MVDTYSCFPLLDGYTPRYGNVSRKRTSRGSTSSSESSSDTATTTTDGEQPSFDATGELDDDQCSHSTSCTVRPAVHRSGLVFSRAESGEPSDDDILLVTVRLRGLSSPRIPDTASDLPERPPRRGFFKRMSTRWPSLHGTPARYRTLRMPRREYRRFFAKDKFMNYVGTEPEREWDEEDLVRRFEGYQHLPLYGIAC